ncbi:phage holin family protein [Roseomonas marmotae]|uniref:Phage holin family protein n=1 Tax=Roseomonas marmotae TaxID=2768161 RepID=A0ABS3K7H0_9PROT|nr:phage holin family protein [Roseomonas marmotae]MBO1073380.1 phage holin family protein [Roseomonas marmotae]QTI80420.1 phage holin family protein [Roseomonas marmotae]
MGFLVRTLITAVAFWVAELLISGISFTGPINLFIAAIVFGLVNALIRPVIALLSLPLTVITLGLFTLVVNALMFAITAGLMPGMRVSGFWAAFMGAIIVWLVSWAASRAIGDRSDQAATR